MSIKRTRTPLIFLAIAALSPTAGAEDSTGPECRGVAAGVVAAMRAAGEITGDASAQAAVVAARRACTAAREDLGPTPVNVPQAAAEKTADAEKMSIWDLLSSDQGEKPGNKRLKRLRQQ